MYRFWNRYTSGTFYNLGHTVNADRYVGQVNMQIAHLTTLYITGVQLEAGTTATDFEFLPLM
jgi:hypothetical protein